MDYGGWYDYKKDSVGFKSILDILFIAGMGPTGGGRNPITPRLSHGGSGSGEVGQLRSWLSASKPPTSTLVSPGRWLSCLFF